MHPQFPNLFSPLTLGKLTLRNRIALLPMGSRFASKGSPEQGDIAFYAARAKGGVGLIITGAAAVHPSTALRNRGRYEPFNEEALPGIARLVDAIHAEGAAVFGQLFHAGRIPLGESDYPTWGPSAIASPLMHDPQIPHAMTTSEVEDMVTSFGISARNFCKAGYDGVEIHAAHGYLVAQFLSESSNKREDRYGGSEENRMRFLLDIVHSIRTHAGPDTVLGVRLSAEEGEDVVDGITLPYTERIAKALAATGKVDYISVTLGIRGAYVKDMSVHVGPSIPYAKAIRNASGLPVIAGLRINQPSLAEQALAGGAADLIGMARPLITDWEWAAKARDGRVEEIRPCIACNQVCRSGALGCVHSPTAGRETIWGPGSLKPAMVKKKVVVVGGGPGGLEAAIQAAERGHSVVILEASKKLGGQARVASLAPNRTEVDGVVSYRALELNRLGVKVRLGVVADVDVVLAEKPDVVVLATGAVPLPPDVEGGELPHVIDVVRALEPDAATSGLIKSASTAVVVDDGSAFWETSSAAEAMASHGLRVTLVSPAHMIAANLPFEAVTPLIRRLLGAGVRLLTLHRVSSIAPGKVLVYNAEEVMATQVLREEEIPADVVVYFSGKRSIDSLSGQLKGRVPELHAIGDCLSPRRINHAVLEGHKVGRSI